MTTLQHIVPAVRTLEGAGFEVRRPFPSQVLQAVGPYILFDHIGPADIAPGKAVGAPVHPHAGLETVSLMFEGGGRHMDSLGNVSVTGPGEVQWMRAGKGIIHDEGPTDDMRAAGGRVHGVQLWLNMPGKTKYDPPDYRHIRADEIPETTEAGATVRVIAGEQNRQHGPLETHAAPLLLSAEFQPGATFAFDLAAPGQYGIYVMSGALSVGEPAHPLGEGEIGLLAGEGITLPCRAGPEGAHGVVIGGGQIQEQLVRAGPFVANSREHMQEIVTAYQAGKFGAIAGA